MERADIAIVGAGTVGCALAARLAALGYEVALVDAQEEPKGRGRVVALSAASLRLLDLPATVFRAPIREVLLAMPERHLWLRADEIGNEHLGAAADLGDLVATLRARIKEQVRVLCPWRLVDLGQDASGVQLRLVQGNRMQTLAARLCIAADGAGGMVARLAGFRTRFGWPHNRFALITELALSRPPFGAALERLGADALVLLPWREGRYALIWTLPPAAAARLMQAEEGAFLARVAVAMGEAARAAFGEPQALVGARSCVPLALGLAPPAVRGRVWLAGASAHHLHPIAAQGLNLGLRDVRVITEVLAQDWARRDPGAYVAGETYAQRRVPDIAATVAFTEALELLHDERGLPARLARRLGLRMLAGLAPLRRGLLTRFALEG